MERRPSGTVRDNWPEIVTDQGLTYWQTQFPDGSTRSYWSESAHYAFSAAEVEQMYEDMKTLLDMCVTAGDFILAHPEIMDRMAIPEWARPMIAQTWNPRDAAGEEIEVGSVYGRIDAVYGGNRFLDLVSTDPQDAFDDALGRIRLYEFNADTPTSLLETAIIQWDWFDKTKQGDDQWNGVYEMLVDAWKRNLALIEAEIGHKPTVYFACTWNDNLLPEFADAVPPDQRADITVEDCSYEDLQNLRVMQETCREAGYETQWLYVEQIHLGENGRFYSTVSFGTSTWCSSCTPGSSSAPSPSAPRSSRTWPAAAAPSGSSRPTRCCGPTRACCPCCGSCSSGTPSAASC
jgi:glutathionylspermidine synthase